MPVLHQKTARNHAQLLKTKALVEVSGMGIGTHHGIKLKNPEAVGLSPGNTVQNKLLADMQSPGFSADRIACIGDMPAAAFVVGVQDIKPQNIIGRGSLRNTAFRNTAVGLRGEKCRAGCVVQRI